MFSARKSCYNYETGAKNSAALSTLIWRGCVKPQSYCHYSCGRKYWRLHRQAPPSSGSKFARYYDRRLVEDSLQHWRPSVIVPITDRNWRLSTTRRQLVIDRQQLISRLSQTCIPLYWRRVAEHRMTIVNLRSTEYMHSHRRYHSRLLKQQYPYTCKCYLYWRPSARADVAVDVASRRTR